MIRILLAALLLAGASCQGSSVNSGMASLEDLNRLAAAITGRTDLHGSVDAGLEAVRQRSMEFEAASKAAYDKAIADGATVEEAKKAAEEAGRIGWGAGLGMAGLFFVGALGYFRRNKTRIPATVNTMVATAHQLGLIDETNRDKLNGLTTAVTQILKAGTLPPAAPTGAPPAPPTTPAATA